MKIPFLDKFKRSEIPDEIISEEPLRISDIVAPSFIQLKQNYLAIGEKLAKTYFVFSYPRYLQTGWLSPLVNLNVPLDISYHLHPVPTEDILKKLRRRVTEVQAEVAEREEKGLIRDPTLEAAHQNLEELRDRLQTAQERMFRFSLYVTVYGDSEKELRQTETTLRSILESRLIYIKPALYQQKEGFVSSSPYGLDILGVTTLMNTSPLSSTFPFISFDLSSNEGILYGINKHNNSLVLFDRFTLPNPNSCVFAVSGAGKSVVASTPVLFKEKGKTKMSKIGPLIENLIKRKGLTKIDQDLEGVVNPEIEVFSFNKDLKGEWSKVSVAARKDAPKYFYKFKTKSGREITTTGDHNMLALKKGKVIAAKSSEIKKGEYVPLPKEVVQKGELTYINLLNILKNSEKAYVREAGDLIRKNYDILKKTVISQKYDRYLYKYRDGRPVPIKYFWKILGVLKIKSDSKKIKRLKIASKNRGKQYSLPINFPITVPFLKLLGFIAAEGTTGEKAIMISNLNKEVLQEIDNCFQKLNIPFFYGNQGINSSDRIYLELVKKLGGFGKSGHKRVCPFIFNMEKAKIAGYLSAYFEGDGGVEKSSVTAASKSKRLVSEISYLLYCFGIISRISTTKKKTSDWKRKKTYYKLTISGQENLESFAKNINFLSKEKRGKLQQITGKRGNTNIDIVPGLQSVFQEIYDLFSPQLYGIREVTALKLGNYNPSPKQLQRTIDKIEERIQQFKKLEPTLKILEEIPDLAWIIETGKGSQELNSRLWENLGWSWGIMKNQKFKPLSKNAFKAIKTINGDNYSLVALKERIHSGFKEMGLQIKYHKKPALQRILVQNKKENCSYETIQEASRFVWKNYQKMLNNKVPLVEEKLEQLKVLANSNLLWDPIVKIEKVKNKKENYVYDLTVDNEVFLAGQGGMFVHNSYSVKLEILRSLMLGTDCIVIDPENEYKFLCDAVGGSFFNISLASDSHINPFDLPVPGEDESPEDVLRSNVINLVGLIRVMLGGLSPEEDSIIDKAITETYAAKDITAESNPKQWGKELPFPTLGDFESVLSTIEGGESLVRRIQRFTTGAYSKFFNNPSNVNVKNRMVVFGIRNMEDELRPMALFIILRYIWKTVTSKMKKRLLIIDEAWWLMNNEDGASFLFGTVKRARKYWLGVTTITQDINDFMKSDYGKPIITNSSLTLLMKQSSATIDMVQKTFSLTDEEKMLLLESPVGEGIFFAGNKHILMKIRASYAEDQIITTAPEEVQKIKQAKKELEG